MKTCETDLTENSLTQSSSNHEHEVKQWVGHTLFEGATPHFRQSGHWTTSERVISISYVSSSAGNTLAH